jgi:cytochrome P450
MSGIMSDLAVQAEKQVTQIIRVPLGIPSPANIRFKRVRKKFDDILYSIINKRKKDIADGVVVQQDILQMLLVSDDVAPGEGMSDKQIRDELTTLFMAGYETTSQTLSWLFYKVAQQPEIAALIRTEPKNNYAEPELSIHHLATRNYTTSVIRETMRFYPSVWLIVRKNISNCALAEYFLPAQSVILLNVYGMHHNETYWEKPEAFLPDRFNDPAIREKHPYSYIPFGLGPRLCIGQPLAMLLMQIVVSRLVGSFDCKPAGIMKTDMEAHITLRPKPAIHIHFTPVGQS